MVTLFVFHVVILTVILNLINEIALLLLVSLESVEFGFEAEAESPGFDRVQRRDRHRG